MRGLRKMLFGAFVILTTLAALWMCLCYGETGKVLFPSYATFAAAALTAVVIGNVGEWAAKRGQS